MSQQNPIRIFVTHMWEDTDDYSRAFEYLESARGLFYKNLSTPEQRPEGDSEVLKENLRKQMADAEIVIALASLHPAQQVMLAFQVNYAKSQKKPVVLLKHFGVQKPLPDYVVKVADDVIDWDGRAFSDSVRRLARGENTARWDVIEFNPD